MTQITAIKFTNFRNGEFRALHTEGVDFAKAITDKDVKQVKARAVRKYNKKKAAENAANEAANEAAPTTDSVSTVGVENAA